MGARLPVGAVLVFGLWVLLATTFAEAHPRAVSPIKPSVATETPDTELGPPPADPVEPLEIAAEVPDATHDSGEWLAGPPPVSLAPILALVLATVLGTAMGARRPRAMAVGLSLAVSVFAVQTAIHSVHHIGHPHDAERCPVFSASQHTPGDVPALVPVDRPVEGVAELVLADSVSFVSDPALRLEQGRAPPSLPV